MGNVKEFRFIDGGPAPANWITELLRKRQINGTGFILLATIQNLQGKNGCFASNEYLASVCGIGLNMIQKQLATLKKLGVLKTRFQENSNQRLLIVTPPVKDYIPCNKVTRKEGIKNYTGCNGSTSEGCNGSTPEGCNGSTPIKETIRLKETSRLKTLSATEAVPDGEVIFDDVSGGKDHQIHQAIPIQESSTKENTGLGFEAQDETETPFDIKAAAKLEEAVRKLPPRKTGIKNAKPSTWARHITLLRTKDDISPNDIKTVMKWYISHIGEEFAPRAFSGETFREKFIRIEERMKEWNKQNILSTIQPGPSAMRIANRLLMLCWPKGSGEDVPRATEACLSAYRRWCADRDLFVNELQMQNTAGTVSSRPDAKRLWRFGKQLQGGLMPPDTFFAEKWMERVQGKVKGWNDWNGDLTAMLFKPESKEFQAMGRGYAEQWSEDPGLWDTFYEVMGVTLGT